MPREIREGGEEAVKDFHFPKEEKEVNPELEKFIEEKYDYNIKGWKEGAGHIEEKKEIDGLVELLEEIRNDINAGEGISYNSIVWKKSEEFCKKHENVDESGFDLRRAIDRYIMDFNDVYEARNDQKLANWVTNKEDFTPKSYKDFLILRGIDTGGGLNLSKAEGVVLSDTLKRYEEEKNVVVGAEQEPNKNISEIQALEFKIGNRKFSRNQEERDKEIRENEEDLKEFSKKMREVKETLLAGIGYK